MAISKATLRVGTIVASSLLAGTLAIAAQDKPHLGWNNPEPVEYCKSTVNSTGLMSHTMVIGDLSISRNETWLHSYSCPPNTYGVFLMGEKQGFLPFGNGYLCISPFESPIYYLGDPGLTDDWGSSFLHLDFAPGPLHDRVLPGTTWNFQCYFRDYDAGGARFNLSSAVSATFFH